MREDLLRDTASSLGLSSLRELCVPSTFRFFLAFFLPHVFSDLSFSLFPFCYLTNNMSSSLSPLSLLLTSFDIPSYHLRRLPSINAASKNFSSAFEFLMKSLPPDALPERPWELKRLPEAYWTPGKNGTERKYLDFVSVRSLRKLSFFS